MLNQTMKKICILGISGAGKTHFARKLADKTKLPLHHMDQLFWAEGWRPVADDKWQRKEEGIVKQDQWIIEGYIDSDHCGRLTQADHIIFLDYSGLRCAMNGLKRWLAYRNKTRPEMAEDCTETLDLKFIWTMLRRKERPEIIKALKTVSSQNKIITLNTPSDAKKWLKTV